MKAGSKEGLVGVDVPNTSQERLVEQQRLEPGSAGSQPGHKLHSGDRQRVGAESLRLACEPADGAELPHIVEQDRAAVQHQDHARVRAWRGAGQQFSCHPQMNGQQPLVEVEKDVLAVAADVANRLPRRRQDGAGPRLFREAAHFQEPTSRQTRRHRPHYCFDFREFRHLSDHIREGLPQLVEPGVAQDEDRGGEAARASTTGRRQRRRLPSSRIAAVTADQHEERVLRQDPMASAGSDASG